MFIKTTTTSVLFFACKQTLLLRMLMVALMIQAGSAHLPRLPSFPNPAEIVVNVPQAVGNILGKVFHGGHTPDGLRHNLGPVAVNINFPKPQQQQYNSANYQFGPPMTPTNMQSGFYPPHPQPQYYAPTTQHFGAGYYPVSQLPLDYQHPPQHFGPHHMYLPLPTAPNPYMRPTAPPAPHSEPIMILAPNVNMPPLAPLKDYRKKSNAAEKLKKSEAIITPDSPKYIPIPEDKPTIDIEPRR